jgi:predicted nucleotidyltransferase
MGDGRALSVAAALAQREHVLILASRGYRVDVSELADKLGALRAAVDVFTGSGVGYALIGGLAVGVRSGVPRATLDVDFAIDSRTDRAKLASLLGTRGFRATGQFAHSVNFLHASGEPVQLAFDEAFDPMIARAEEVAVGDLQLRVVTKDDLIAMKRRAAADPARRRSKALRDQADVALLEGDVPEPGEGW